jgi:hypothetical protein
VGVGEKNAATWSERSPYETTGSHWIICASSGCTASGMSGGTIVVVVSRGPTGGGMVLVALAGGHSFAPDADICIEADVIVSM